MRPIERTDIYTVNLHCTHHFSFYRHSLWAYSRAIIESPFPCSEVLHLTKNSYNSIITVKKLMLIHNEWTCRSLPEPIKYKQSMTASSLLRLFLEYRIYSNHGGREVVTKQQFCKTPSLGTFKDRGTSDSNQQSSLRARILLLHSPTHSLRRKA